ncbi:MAG: outer membrane lipoprotein-sorting protein [Gammaproteobacteria bacterium]|nr:outer membrane lipoprotein-sorting protein [Gammaproteobacteria bacterium]
MIVKFKNIVFIALMLISVAPALVAQSLEEKGKFYAQAWKDSDIGFGNSTSKIEMTLYDKKGNESKRSMNMNVLENDSENEGDKVLLTFLEPKNIKNSRVLIHSLVGTGDDVWLYLPAVKRVKHVSSADRSGAFSGSEFSYEDIGSMEIDNYKYLWLKEEPCGELICAVVEQIPQYPYSGYSSIRVWFDKTHYRQMKIEFYDRKKLKFKTLELAKYEQFSGKYWRALDMRMTNHVTGKKTILLSSNVEFGHEIRKTMFEPSRLKNVTN